YWPSAEIVSGLDDVKSKPSNTSVQIAYGNARSGDVDLAMADFDGDGNTDLATYTSWTVSSANKTTYKLNWYSLNGSTFTLRGNLYQEEKNNIYQGSDGYYYDASALKRLETPDINGDGLSDVALKMNFKWQYAISNGNGLTNYVSLADLTNNNPSWFFDVNRDGQIDLVRVTYDTTLKLYSYFVSYWSTKQNQFSAAELLRTTPNQVMTVGDANGDGWLDFVEFDQAAKTNNQNYIKIFGYTNSDTNVANGYPGVLKQDAIVSVKTGLRNSVAIEYQSLIRPNRVEQSICSGSYAGAQGTACQDYYGISHYQSLRFDVQLKPGSLDAESVDTKNYYRKTNEPFTEFNNSHAGTARVTQHFGVIPIVTRVKSTSTNASLFQQLDTDKKYFYSVLRKQAGGRGLLGFEKTSVEDLLAGTKTETSWRQDWPYTGIVAKLEEKDLQGATLREADNQLTLKVSSESSGAKIFTPITQGQLVKTYAAPTVAGQTGRLLNTQLVGAQSSLSATSSSVRSSSSAKSATTSSSVIAAPVSVELTAPGEGATLNYELGNSVSLSAVVKAADGSIWKDTDGLPPKVVFYNYWMDSVKDQSRLYEPLATGMADGTPVNWTPDSQGIYAIRAMAYLNNGTILYSKLAGVWVNRPAGTPAARLMATSYGNSYSTDWTFNFAVEASDEDGIENVSFYANDTFIGNGTSINGSTAPRLDWKPSVLGQYKIYALVKDKTGKVSKTKTMLANYG
ncbi:FG-GAP repeat domain-containing protein, partial [Cellvibrio sp.]